MNIDGFLRFWSQYNIAIIEVLIGVILLTVIYLAFRSFFGAEEPVTEGGSGELRSAELEKTLQKILERQNATAEPVAPSVSPGLTAEVEKLKAQLAERGQQLEELKKVAAKVEAGVTDQERKGFEDRVKDLEARLAEYEIISEDIADLSFYKEENSKMQAEIATLKAEIESLKSIPVVEEPPPTPDPVDKEAAALEEIFAESVAAPPEPSSEAVIEERTPEAALTEEASPVVSDEPKKEDAELMDQFENFVKKG